MNNKIATIQQNYNSVDTDMLKENLTAADIEELSVEENEERLFKEQGIIPNKIRLSNIDKFMIKKAFWDVYKPIDESKKGVWILESDSEGNKFIVRTDA